MTHRRWSWVPKVTEKLDTIGVSSVGRFILGCCRDASGENAESPTSAARRAPGSVEGVGAGSDGSKGGGAMGAIAPLGRFSEKNTKEK